MGKFKIVISSKGKVLVNTVVEATDYMEANFKAGVIANDQDLPAQIELDMTQI